MKCKFCDGSGKVVHPMMSMNGDEYTGEWEQHECEACNGTGVVEPLTNEEWFCQLPTTEKSEFLSAMVKQAIKVYEIHGCTWHETVSWWDGWLKEKHND